MFSFDKNAIKYIDVSNILYLIEKFKIKASLN